MKSLRALLALCGKAGLTSPNPVSITPVVPFDVVRRLLEAGFTRIAIDYSNDGRVPFTGGLRYQSLLPFLKRRLWSDNYRIVASLG